MMMKLLVTRLLYKRNQTSSGKYGIPPCDIAKMQFSLKTTKLMYVIRHGKDYWFSLFFLFLNNVYKLSL